jgi:hypothetical protein
MTIFSNDEEYYVEKNLMGGGQIPFYVFDALKIAGGKLEFRRREFSNPIWSKTANSSPDRTLLLTMESRIFS